MVFKRVCILNQISLWFVPEGSVGNVHQHWLRLWFDAATSRAIDQWWSERMIKSYMMVKLSFITQCMLLISFAYNHVGTMEWQLFPLYWPDMGGIHRWSVDSHHRASNTELEYLFYVSLNKLLNKKSNYRWFETPWHLCDVTVMTPEQVYALFMWPVTII